MLTMVVTRWRRRFRSNRRTGHSLLDLLIPTPLNPPGLPSPPTLSPQPTPLSTPLPSWLEEPIPSPVIQEPCLSFPQESNIVMTLLWLNKAGEGLFSEVLVT